MALDVLLLRSRRVAPLGVMTLCTACVCRVYPEPPSPGPGPAASRLVNVDLSKYMAAPPPAVTRAEADAG